MGQTQWRKQAGREAVRRIMRARGFTLVELLVVIAIITVLISVLLPALSKARNQSVRVVCSSNMRQLYTAIMQYSYDYRGMLPVTDTGNAGNSGSLNDFSAQGATITAIYANTTNSGQTVYGVNDTFIGNQQKTMLGVGLLFYYQPISKVYMCPGQEPQGLTYLQTVYNDYNTGVVASTGYELSNMYFMNTRGFYSRLDSLSGKFGYPGVLPGSLNTTGLQLPDSTYYTACRFTSLMQCPMDPLSAEPHSPMYGFNSLYYDGTVQWVTIPENLHTAWLGTSGVNTYGNDMDRPFQGIWAWASTYYYENGGNKQ